MVQDNQSPALIQSKIGDYKYLNSAFYNMDDEQRSFISSNYQQQEDEINDYLVF